jgi:hypothetical protein
MIRPMPRRSLSWILALALPAAPAASAPDAGGPGDLPRLLRGADGRIAVAGARLEPLAPPARTEPRSVAAAGDGWLVAGTTVDADRSELWLARGGPRGWREVAPPAERVGAWRQGPALIAGNGEVAGLAWLEGDAHDRFAVRFAPWDGERFGPATTLAPPGPGSQLALSGAALADGRLLLVWAGYDGSDDEIWSAVGRDGAWSAPERVAPDDEAPDITPTLVAEGRGALVAWSRFDGSEYRLVLARFDGGRFGPARWVAAPGTLFPSFERLDGRLGLLYRDARGDAWVLSELDESGSPRRSTRLAAPDDVRPVARAGSAGVTWWHAGSELRTTWE